MRATSPFDGPKSLNMREVEKSTDPFAPPTSEVIPLSKSKVIPATRWLLESLNTVKLIALDVSDPNLRSRIRFAVSGPSVNDPALLF